LFVQPLEQNECRRHYSHGIEFHSDLRPFQLTLRCYSLSVSIPYGFHSIFESEDLLYRSLIMCLFCAKYQFKNMEFSNEKNISRKQHRRHKKSVFMSIEKFNWTMYKYKKKTKYSSHSWWLSLLSKYKFINFSSNFCV
jgi:hypothetical protein